LLLPRHERQGIGWPAGRNWLKKDVKAEESSNEHGRIGQHFIAARSKSVGNGSSITMAFREKGFYPPYTWEISVKGQRA
jgi:hypothetical protein